MFHIHYSKDEPKLQPTTYSFRGKILWLLQIPSRVLIKTSPVLGGSEIVDLLLVGTFKSDFLRLPFGNIHPGNRVFGQRSGFPLRGSSIRLSESIRKVPEVTILSPGESPLMISTRLLRRCPVSMARGSKNPFP